MKPTLFPMHPRFSSLRLVRLDGNPNTAEAYRHQFPLQATNMYMMGNLHRDMETKQLSTYNITFNAPADNTTGAIVPRNQSPASTLVVIAASGQHAVRYLKNLFETIKPKGFDWAIHRFSSMDQEFQKGKEPSGPIDWLGRLPIGSMVNQHPNQADQAAIKTLKEFNTDNINNLEQLDFFVPRTAEERKHSEKPSNKK